MYHLDEDPVMQKLITDRFIGFLNEVAKDIDIPPQILLHYLIPRKEEDGVGGFTCVMPKNLGREELRNAFNNWYGLHLVNTPTLTCAVDGSKEATDE